MKLKDWFHNRYNSLAETAASERLQAKKLKKQQKFHQNFTNSLETYHRNRANRQDSIVPEKFIKQLL